MMNKRVQIIAEAGVNHNGSLDLALKLVDEAAKAGADIVKFQTFKASKLASQHAKKAKYQLKETSSAESQVTMLQRLELDEKDHQTLLNHCHKKNIQFLSSPFDFVSADLLVKHLNLNTIKIGSGEITNAPLLLKVAQLGCDVILSTGMATLGEIEDALGVLAYGYLYSQNKNPSLGDFRNAYFSNVGYELLRNKVTLLLCTTEYPAPFDAVDLRVMDTIRSAFNLPVGFSDHTKGVAVPIAAVARGAAVIEKHFTLDRTLLGPDHKASLEPEELKNMVDGIRQVEMALGDSRKILHNVERDNAMIARKSLVAAIDIKKGEILTTNNLTTKRPGDGISPMRYWDTLGKTATRNYSAGDKINSND